MLGWCGIQTSTTWVACSCPSALCRRLPPNLPGKPFQAQSSSTISLSAKNDESSVEITNVTYEVAGPEIPTRPPDELLVLRKTTHSKQVLGDIGMDATTTVEAWPLGVDLKQKPRYSVAVSGTDCQTIDNALLVVSRGLEETESP